MSGTILDEAALRTLFLEARSQNGWQDKDVTEEQIHQLYDLMKMGPTAVNCCPARIYFVRSQEAKERLKPCLAEGNIEKSMTAPVVAIIGMDLAFYSKLGYLFPHAEDAHTWYEGKPDKIMETAFRNGTLQGAYLIMAARSLGLDCGPMSGFDADKVNAEFFTGTDIKVNFICGIGYGDPAKVFDRLPRLPFDESCKIL